MRDTNGGESKTLTRMGTEVKKEYFNNFAINFFFFFLEKRIFLSGTVLEEYH